MSNEGRVNTAQNVISHEPHRARQKRIPVQIWDRERRDRRYAGIASAVGKSPKMTSSDDRKIVATNLWGILERFEREGKGKKVEILQKVNMGDEDSSTKQLFHYTLPPSDNTAASRLAKRSSKLVKRIENYKKIAKQ